MDEQRSTSTLLCPTLPDPYRPYTPATGYPSSAWGYSPFYPSSSYGSYAYGYPYSYPWPAYDSAATYPYYSLSATYHPGNYPLGDTSLRYDAPSPAPSYASDLVDSKPALPEVVPAVSSVPSEMPAKVKVAKEESSGEGKPPYSYIALVAMAISNNLSEAATLREIISYIEDRFPYYRNKTTWQRSLRHCLTLNDCFVKRPRRHGDKGHPWAIDAEFRDMFDNGSLMRRRYRFKEGSVNWHRSKARAARAKVTASARACATPSTEDTRLPSVPTSQCSWLSTDEQRGALDTTLASDLSLTVDATDSCALGTQDITGVPYNSTHHSNDSHFGTSPLFLDCEQTQDFWNYPTFTE